MARKKKRPRGVSRTGPTATECRKCGSKSRTKYHQTRTLEINGILPSGQGYRAITWRRTECCGCGQSRIDKTYEVTNAQSSAEVRRRTSETSAVV